MRLGVLSWEKLKNRETHSRIVRLDPLGKLKCNFWSLHHVYRLNESKSLAKVLILNIQSPHEDNLSFCERYNIITSKALGIIHAQPFQVLIAERERSIYDSCRFDIGRFRAEPTNYERFLHPSHWHICISQCPQKLVSYATRNPQVKTWLISLIRNQKTEHNNLAEPVGR